MPTSEAQKRANLKWREVHREQYKKIRNNQCSKWKEDNIDLWTERHRGYSKKCAYRRYWWGKISQEFLSILLE
jgi:hypothetical protein